MRAERAKILPPRKMREVVRRLQAAGRTVAFTNGCFDILHAGHARFLRRAREEGDCLVVGLNSDASVRRLKGPGRPIVPQADRAELLAALAAVDYVTVFGEDTPARLIADLLPDVLVKGADYGRGEIVGRRTVEEAGGRVVRVPLLRGRSTSALVGRVRDRGRRSGGA
ncbi:MAG: D-glycero-beta-D-manno-heptose 1-phosphate adenylyltransferase [bacterium]|nr:D-glycero-beta-D-manno-heptose 1-phosphate adenylyltransferase [bacterium]